jgi:hypothetical protein
MGQQSDLQALIRDRVARLPKVVQEAITSPDTERTLRDLATTHQLTPHQRDRFENEVLMALLGAAPIQELQHNISVEVGVSDDVARQLTDAVVQAVFEPLRAQLSQQPRQPRPAAEDTGSAPVPEGQRTTPISPAPAVQPATPPSPKPDIKIARPPDSTAYRLGESSTGRRVVDDDPYREPTA